MPVKSLGSTGTRYTTTSSMSVLYPIVPVSCIVPASLPGKYRHYTRRDTPSVVYFEGVHGEAFELLVGGIVLSWM